jgi:hypothetical protein
MGTGNRFPLHREYILSGRILFRTQMVNILPRKKKEPTFDQVHDEVLGFVTRVEEAIQKGIAEATSNKVTLQALQQRNNEIANKIGFLSNVKGSFSPKSSVTSTVA